MAQLPAGVSVGHVDLTRFSPEEAIIAGRDVYFHLPNGMGRAKLPNYVGRHLEVPITIRNWNTVTKLGELTAG